MKLNKKYGYSRHPSTPFDKTAMLEIVDQIRIVCETDILLNKNRPFNIIYIRNLYAAHVNEYLLKIQNLLASIEDDDNSKHMRILAKVIEDDRKNFFRPYGEC